MQQPSRNHRRAKPKRNVILPERGEELDEHEEEEGDDEDDDGDDDPPPIRGPHTRGKNAAGFGERLPLEPRSKGSFGARMAAVEDEEIEDDEELEDEDCESDEDADRQ